MSEPKDEPKGEPPTESEPPSADDATQAPEPEAGADTQSEAAEPPAGSAASQPPPSDASETPASDPYETPSPDGLPEPEPVPVITARVRTLTDFERAAANFPDSGTGRVQGGPVDHTPTGRFLREGLLSALRAPFLRPLLRVPLKKVAIWASFLGLIYSLREFFGLIFLTFVISYISSTIVERLSPYFSNRKVPVVLVFAAIVGLVVGLGVATVPRALKQGKAQLDKLGKIDNIKHYVEVRIAKFFGMPSPDEINGEAELTAEEQAQLAIAGISHSEAKTGEAKTGEAKTGETKTGEAKTGEAKTGEAKTGEAKTGEAKTGEAKTGETKTGEAKTGETKTGEVDESKSAGGDEKKPAGWGVGIARTLADPEINAALADTLGKAAGEYLIPSLKSLLKGIYVGVAYFLAALIFSFMIVWDLPKLARATEGMENSRLGDVWGEVTPSIGTFFTLLGKAFEAQTMIALVNTAITALGMWILGIPGIGFLAVVVFVCSFIPIVGMFISTVPICLVALQSGGGLQLVVAVIVMIMVAHAIEAYVLNPRIYGYHMKLHPLAVLIVLYLGQHLFGMWGLVVGVPVATYIWRHLIHGEGSRSAEAPADPDAPEPLPDPQPA